MRQKPNPNHKNWFPIIKSRLHGTGSLTPPAHWPPSAPDFLLPWGAAYSPATSNTSPSNSINSQFAWLKLLSRCVSAGPHGLTWTRVGPVQDTETAGLCEPKRGAALPVWKPRAGLREDKLSSSSWFLAAESCRQSQTECLEVTQSKFWQDSLTGMCPYQNMVCFLNLRHMGII